MNFLPTPSQIMNEILFLPTIHYMLQNIVYVLTMHPFPSPTQQTCHHCDKICASASKEIFDCHFMLVCVQDNNKSDGVYESIPWWMNMCCWQNNYLQNIIGLPPILTLIQKLQDPKVPNNFTIIKCWPRICIQQLMHLGTKLSLPKRLERKHLHCSQKIKLASSSLVTSS